LDELDTARAGLANARVLFTDLDGTLLGLRGSLLTDSAGAPSLDAVNAIAALNRAGLSVVVTSGRNARQLRELTRLLDWPDFIGELGCLRSYDRGGIFEFDTGEWPTGALLEGETPYEAIERVGAVAALMDRFRGLIEYHDPWHLDREVTHLVRGNVPIDEAQAVLDDLALPVSIIDNGIIHPRAHGLVGVDEVHAMHLVPTGTNKEASIRAYLSSRGLSPDEAIAVGDSAADMAMADVVGTAFCVANGLADRALVSAAASRPNVAALRGMRGSGWAELAHAWLAARGA
jgi:HAD superfamily hydrolase (TIGR01484 family)